MGVGSVALWGSRPPRRFFKGKLMWKIDTSVLQAGALVIAGVLAVISAFQSNWNITGMAITGLFAILSIHPKAPGNPDDGSDK